MKIKLILKENFNQILPQIRDFVHDTNNVYGEDEISAFIRSNKKIIKQNADVVRQYGSKRTEFAYYFALYIDEGPHDITRSGTVKPDWAFLYAFHIDKGPHNVTRQNTIKDKEGAYYYAKDIDKKPRDDTRFATGGLEMNGLEPVDIYRHLYEQLWPSSEYYDYVGAIFRFTFEEPNDWDDDDVDYEGPIEYEDDFDDLPEFDPNARQLD